MAESIISGLFGPTPYEMQQQRQQAVAEQANKYAQLDPFQRATQSIYQGGAGLAQAGAGMMGMVNPQEQQAELQTKIMASGVGDIGTSQGMLAKAEEFRKAGDLRTAAMLTMKGTELKRQEAAAALAQRKQDETEAFRRYQLTENMELKRQQLERDRDRDRDASEDRRLTIEQREAASKRADSTDRLLGQLMASVKLTTSKDKLEASGLKPTEGQKAVDKLFAKEYAEYIIGGGAADVDKNLTQLSRVIDELQKPKNDYTGAVVGLIPDKMRAITNPAAVDAKQSVEEVVQRNLRLILGAQFTKDEGERLIARAYNPQLSPAVNARKVKALVDQIRKAAQAKDSANTYYEANGTLMGWKGTMPTLTDINNAIDAVPSTDDTAPSGNWSIRPKGN